MALVKKSPLGYEKKISKSLVGSKEKSEEWLAIEIPSPVITATLW